MRLRVVADYQAGVRRYRAGEVIEAGERLAEFLLRDAPGCFEVIDPEPRAEAPKPLTRPQRKDLKRR